MVDSKPVRKEIGGYTFYIRPMSAMKCAALSGDLAAVVVPLMSALLPLAGGDMDNVNLVEAAPAIAGAFSTLSGEKLQKLIAALLVDDRTIGVEGPGINGATMMDEKTMDLVFAGNAQNMFVLAFYVINANFGDFFGSLGTRYGGAIEKLKVPGILKNMES